MQLYQESDDSTFQSNGKIYSLNVLFKRTQHRPSTTLEMNLLDWILEHTSVDEERVKTADVSIPVLVFLDPKLNKWVLVDGAHRLTKLSRASKKIVPVKILTNEDMKAAYLHDTDGTKRVPLYTKW